MGKQAVAAEMAEENDVDAAELDEAIAALQASKPKAEENEEEEKRKRKEEKKKRKLAVAEEAAAAEEPAGGEAPKKRRKIESAAADKIDDKAPKKHSSASTSGTELTVRVGGLSLTCTEESIHRHFSKFGEIKSLRVPGKKKSHGIAFITFSTMEDVEKAVKLNASDYEGCTLRVNLSEKDVKGKSDKAEGKSHSKGSSSLQIFVGGLPFNADEVTLRHHFRKCGKIASFQMPLSARNCPKGIAFVTYATQEGVDKALLLDGKNHGGRTLKVNKADVEAALKVEAREKQVKDSALKVFVGGLPLEADEAALRKTFGECGEIASFKKLAASDSEKKRGHVFITFKTPEGLENALKLDSTDYRGRTLKVKRAGDGKAKVKDGSQKGKDETGKAKGKDGKGKGKSGKGKSNGKGAGKKGKKS